jgi:hypothetical protein
MAQQSSAHLGFIGSILEVDHSLLTGTTFTRSVAGPDPQTLVRTEAQNRSSPSFDVCAYEGLLRAPDTHPLAMPREEPAAPGNHPLHHDPAAPGYQPLHDPTCDRLQNVHAPPSTTDQLLNVDVPASPHSPQATAHSTTADLDTGVPSTVDEDDAGAMFVRALKLPVLEPLVQTPPCPRPRCRERRKPASVIPRRSDRLAGKSPFRDPNPEKQAKRVLVNKWEGKPNGANSNTPDSKVAEKFHSNFAEPVPDYKWEAMRELLICQAPEGQSGEMSC